MGSWAAPVSSIETRLERKPIAWLVLRQTPHILRQPTGFKEFQSNTGDLNAYNVLQEYFCFSLAEFLVLTWRQPNLFELNASQIRTFGRCFCYCATNWGGGQQYSFTPSGHWSLQNMLSEQLKLAWSSHNSEKRRLNTCSSTCTCIETSRSMQVQIDHHVPPSCLA